MTELIKKCSRCLFTTELSGVTINEKSGQCNFCDLHDAIAKESKNTDVDKLIGKIKRYGKRRKYDCMVLVSGGFDSSYLLHLSVKRFGLRVLAFHYDNGWNNECSENNMKRMIEGTGADFIRFGFDLNEFNNINRAFLLASVSDADIPNDLAMHKVWFDVCHKYKIKYILHGYNYRYEGGVPTTWTYMDAKYIQSVCDTHSVEIKSYPLYTIASQIINGISGIKSIRLLNCIDHDKEEGKAMLTKMYGWADYGSKHAENIYTDFIGSYLLPRKFNINKNLIYLSAMVRSGLMSKEVAEKEYENSSFKEPTTENLKLIEDKLKISIDSIMNIPVGDRNNYKSYRKTFKKYRILFWIGVKLGYFPRNFYNKYCK